MNEGYAYQIPQADLVAVPEIRVGDRVYAVNNRMSAFTAISQGLAMRGEQESELDVILRIALGPAALDEIKAQDLPFPAMRRLVVLAMAAVQDISEAEAERRFQDGTARG